jgi:hypothetical protein
MKSIIVALVSTITLIGAASAQNTQGGAQPPTKEMQNTSPSPSTTGSAPAPATTPRPLGQMPSPATTNPDLGANQPTPNGNSPVPPAGER